MHSQTQPLPPSVNYHLWQPCNMKCRYCFATFLDVKQDWLPKGHLPREASMQVLQELARYFEKVTFAGGEPTLCPWLIDLIRKAHELGCTTMLVTNASKLSADYLSQLEGILDWVTISVDSANSQTMTAIGRSLRRNVISEEGYIEIAQNVKAAGMRLKINSVVTTLNWNEDLVGFIRALGPERWKIFQALPVQGQNDGAVDSLLVTREQFDTFVSRHLPLQREGIEVVPEDNHAMSGSYAMIDPAGRFYDNVDGKHHYSRAIREVGVEQAWQDVRFEAEKFVERGGIYKWK